MTIGNFILWTLGVVAGWFLVVRPLYRTFLTGTDTDFDEECVMWVFFIGAALLVIGITVLLLNYWNYELI